MHQNLKKKDTRASMKYKKIYHVPQQLKAQDGTLDHHSDAKLA
jgi:hypothetical protein